MVPSPQLQASLGTRTALTWRPGGGGWQWHRREGRKPRRWWRGRRRHRLRLQSLSVVSMASDLCRHGVFSVVSCSGLLCSWKPVLRDLLPAAVPSCCVYGFWSVPSWCFHCCVLFRPVMFLETSVERPPVCCSPVLLCLWLLIRALMVFSLLCPVQACYVPGNQCRETCLLQSRPVVPMASDPCRHGVFIVVSCSGLLCSWKPVSRDLLSAAVPSCCAYGFWSVPSWCF